MSKTQARQLGVIYLLYFVTAVLGGLLVKGFAVHGDAAATAQNFAAHGTAVRASSALGLVAVGLYLALTACFYDLFRDVSRRLSLVAALLSVTACGLQVLSDALLALLQLALSRPAGTGSEEWSLLVQSCLAIHAQALASSLVLFGSFDIVIGVLILRSRFVPRVFGVAMVLAGLGWMVYLWPPFAARLSNVVQPLGFLAEVVLMIWLLVRDVDETQWRAEAGVRQGDAE